MFRYMVFVLLSLVTATQAMAATSTYDRFIGNHAKFKNVSTVSLVVSGAA
ncbi:MAG: hypothetical protein ACD_51C00054G0001, partial [uncultured bacterium]